MLCLVRRKARPDSSSATRTRQQSASNEAPAIAMKVFEVVSSFAFLAPKVSLNYENIIPIIPIRPFKTHVLVSLQIPPDHSPMLLIPCGHSFCKTCSASSGECLMCHQVRKLNCEQFAERSIFQDWRSLFLYDGSLFPVCRSFNE